MARINLLPHRAERRRQRQKEFFMHLGMVAACAVAVIIIWSTWMGMRIDNQNDRNAYLQDEIKQLDVRLDKIKDLDRTRSQLLARKQIIEQLQANRSQMVHLFDELVRTIPGSVRLTALKQTGDQMVLGGVAQSNASVADYMRNLQASPWMGQADLSKTENSHDTTRMPYSFGLTVNLQKPKDDDNGANPAAASTAAAAPAAHVVPVPGASAAKPAAVTPVPAASAGVKR